MDWSEVGNPEETHKLWILVGLPGAGKTTWTLNHIVKPVHVDNYDSLKAMDEALRTVLRDGEFQVALDGCNITPDWRQHWAAIAHRNGYQAVAVVLDTSLEDCLQQNDQRSHYQYVPPAGIRRLAKMLVPPTDREPLDAIIHEEPSR